MKVVELKDIMSLCTIVGSDRENLPGIVVKSPSRKREKKTESSSIFEKGFWTRGKGTPGKP